MLLGHTAAITALEFVPLWPVLVTADGNGNVGIWGVRGGPKEHAGKCLCRFVNELDRPVRLPGAPRAKPGSTGGGGGTLKSATALLVGN